MNALVRADGLRRERIEGSPNFRDGVVVNILPTPRMEHPFQLDHLGEMWRAGRWADLTVMDVDPFRAGSGDAPEAILQGRVVLTVVGGKVVYEAGGAGG